MGNSITIRMKGIDTASLVTKKLIAAARAALPLSVSEAAFILETEAKINCPVKTGRLRDGIHTEMDTSNQDTVTAVVTPVVPSDNKWGFDPPYARRIELGFIGTDSLGRHYHQAAQPYMRPAWDAKKQDAVQAIRDGMIEALDTAMVTR